MANVTKQASTRFSIVKRRKGHKGQPAVEKASYISRSVLVNEFDGQISYNKKNLERELQNESRQHSRQQGKVKRREEEI